ncbi:hypothetical protein QQ056_16750 [Oscillatoria laete-virens NRMC-F 0139]|nr:hypothetical protein [Oscillatoria laete-virens]MDL5055183.1 hypothetical protein [Oscillatoria laete-virens NRMC-F 0139]
MIVNPDSFKQIQLNLSGLSTWLIVLGIAWLLGAIGLGWLVQSVLILFAFILIAPVIGFLGFRWWLQRNLILDDCPVCNHEFTALNKTQCRCPNCGEPIQVAQGKFNRLTPAGTIDIDAVEVAVKQIEE